MKKPVLQLYAKLCAVIDGCLQEEMAEITIHDGVDVPARITLSSCIPESGPEFNARKRLGDRVEVAVVILNYGHAPSEPILRMHAKVVAATTSQLVPGTARHAFTLEHCEPEPEPTP